jgi:TIGR03009 family protein
MSQHLAFRRLRRPRRIAVPLSGVILAIGLRLFAQDQGLDPGIAPNTRVGRDALTRPDLHVDPVDPEVDSLLEAWAKHTSGIKTLAGHHFRSTRDFVYGTETLAEGKFFVAMPDKGRIDVGSYTLSSPKAGDKKRYPTSDGKPAELEVKIQLGREKWICDGKSVRVIDDTRGTYEEINIPPNQQGANMIDGPLPFLLGMPPDKAKARYQFHILRKVSDDAILIEVRPRLKMDAAEWVRAYVVLNLRTYLPDNVSLWNQGGTTQTVYIFREIKIDENSWLQKLFGRNPFNPV